MVDVMRRIEKKYILDENTYHALLDIIKQYIDKDGYYKYSILNIYFDTEQYDLIKTSLEKPIYKEKIRLRSYKVPTKKDNVYLEIKKKYKGVVNKRRVTLSLNDVNSYMDGYYFKNDSQIMKEIDYCFKRYKLKPALFLAYDRYAYKGKEDETFRLTFDYDIRFRQNELSLDKGDYGELLFDKKMYIMEVKSTKGLPIWFCKALSDLKIYSTSFSKYGTVYQTKIVKDVL